MACCAASSKMRAEGRSRTHRGNELYGALVAAPAACRIGSGKQALKKPGAKPGSESVYANTWRAQGARQVMPRGGRTGSCRHRTTGYGDALPAEYRRLHCVRCNRKHRLRRGCCTGTCSFLHRLLPICSIQDAEETSQPFLFSFSFKRQKRSSILGRRGSEQLSIDLGYCQRPGR